MQVYDETMRPVGANPELRDQGALMLASYVSEATGQSGQSVAELAAALATFAHLLCQMQRPGVAMGVIIRSIIETGPDGRQRPGDTSAKPLPMSPGDQINPRNRHERRAAKHRRERCRTA